MGWNTVEIELKMFYAWLYQSCDKLDSSIADVQSAQVEFDIFIRLELGHGEYFSEFFLVKATHRKWNIQILNAW